MQKNGSKDKLLKIAGIVFWILLWAAIALFVNQKLILAGPVDTLLSFFKSITLPSFWLSILYSFIHIFIGFIIALIIGSLLAIISDKVKYFHYFISPVVQLFKSAPIVCFIVLLLIWFGTSFVDVVTVIISVIPIYYYAIYQANKEKSASIMDALTIYKVSGSDKFRAYIWPNAFPFVKQATETGVGIAWKAGVTAQMIGVVSNTIGEGIYNSKINLDSSQLIVWMFVVIILGFVTEKLTILILKKSASPANQNNKKIELDENRQISNLDINPDIEINNISAGYDGRCVINNFSYRFNAGKRYAIMGPTGSGKTTLVKSILGIHAGANEKINLVEGQSNTIVEPSKQSRVFSVVFQENTIIPYISIKENLNIVGAGPAALNIKGADSSLPDFLPEGNLMPEELSGGMKRCVEIVRAIEASSNVVVMDEPFAGLDENVKNNAIEYLNTNLGDRTLIIVTHDINDAKALECEVISVP